MIMRWNQQIIAYLFITLLLSAQATQPTLALGLANVDTSFRQVPAGEAAVEQPGSGRSLASHTPLPTDDTGAPSGRRLLECQPQTISLQNNCRYALSVAANALLSNSDGLSSGYCLEGALSSGEWCTRAWFNLDPGSEAQVFLTNNAYWYFYAYSYDSQDNLIEWRGDEDPASSANSTSLLWEELQQSGPTGAVCEPLSSADCKPFIVVNRGPECIPWKQTISCDTYEEPAAGASSATGQKPATNQGTTPPTTTDSEIDATAMLACLGSLQSALQSCSAEGTITAGGPCCTSVEATFSPTGDCSAFVDTAASLLPDWETSFGQVKAACGIDTSGSSSGGSTGGDTLTSTANPSTVELRDGEWPLTTEQSNCVQLAALDSEEYGRYMYLAALTGTALLYGLGNETAELLAVPGADQLGALPVKQVIQEYHAWSNATLTSCGAPTTFTYGDPTDPFAVLSFWATVNDTMTPALNSTEVFLGEITAGMTGRRLLALLDKIFGAESSTGKALAASVVGTGMGFLAGVGGSVLGSLAQGGIVSGLTAAGSFLGGPIGATIGMYSGIVVGAVVSNVIGMAVEGAGKLLTEQIAGSDAAVMEAYKEAANVGGFLGSIKDFGFVKRLPTGAVKVDMGSKTKELMEKARDAFTRVEHENDKIERGLSYAYQNRLTTSNNIKNRIQQFEQELPELLDNSRLYDKQGKQYYGKAIADMTAPFSKTGADLYEGLVGGEGDLTTLPPVGGSDASGSDASGSSSGTIGSAGTIGDVGDASGSGGDASGSSSTDTAGGADAGSEMPMPTCESESDYITHYDHATPPEVVKACQALWAPGALPADTSDAFIGGELTCRPDSYESASGLWSSPRPAVCGAIEGAAAVLGLGPITPGCCLWFWCTNPEPDSAGEISIQWTINMRQAYDFSSGSGGDASGSSDSDSGGSGGGASTPDCVACVRDADCGEDFFQTVCEGCGRSGPSCYTRGSGDKCCACPRCMIGSGSR